MFNKSICLILSILLVTGGFAVPAHAAVVGTGEALALDARMARIADIQSDLARDEVRHALITLGVDPQQAQARVSSLSDTELNQLAGELDTLPAGGDVLALIGAVFVVLLILELTGVINIFGGA
jgi:hypothetical protein